MVPPELYLASRSPRRLELLRGIGADPRPFPVSVPEPLRAGESPREHVARLAEAKGCAAATRLRERGAGLVLSADTVVAIDARILGKPVDPAEAMDMLRTLAGRRHEVFTGVYLARIEDGRSAAVVDSSRVRFRALDESWIRWYVGTGEAMDKAGAYGLQSRGALLAAGIEGSWSNVVGLPLERLPDLFAAVGADLRSFLAPDGTEGLAPGRRGC